MVRAYLRGVGRSSGRLGAADGHAPGRDRQRTGGFAAPGVHPGPALDAMGSGRDSDPDMALRAGLASSMLVGIVVGRRLVGVPILAEAETETLVAMVAPAIQSVLTRTR